MRRRAACRPAGLDELDMTMQDLLDLLAPLPCAADAGSVEPAPGLGSFRDFKLK
jgi:hypothetical protein